jgi:enoyl-CoA hydratase/carnithine racemase
MGALVTWRQTPFTRWPRFTPMADKRAARPPGRGAVSVQVERGIARLRLDRPDKRNAVDVEMWTAIGDRCRALADDASVRVLIVRGAGDHFCAGADIDGLRWDDPDYQRVNLEAVAALAEFPNPSIALIRGSCIGGGVQIAAACDMRFADTTARLGITPARLGILYPPASLRRLLELVSPSSAKHLLFSAELIDAARALRIGLVDEVHEPDAAEERLAAFVLLLAEQRSQLTQQASKAMIDSMPATGGVDGEVAARWADELASADDPDEGVAAFLERRPPRFSWNRPAHRPVGWLSKDAVG